MATYPHPRRADDLLQRGNGRPPAEHVPRLDRAAHQPGRVAGPAPVDPVADIDIRHPPGGFDDLPDRVAGAVAQIIGFGALRPIRHQSLGGQ